MIHNHEINGFAFINNYFMYDKWEIFLHFNLNTIKVQQKIELYIGPLFSTLTVN